MTEKELIKQLHKIALENIVAMEDRQDLEVHRNDAEDFFEISVWELKDALRAAYEMGKAQKE